ncbi:MAG: pyridoxamine 5'-phosphate oxidase family protein [Planctomycetes bacterium]|nr:pyridoxamine 5'-phosphate oxidase family protein [Planctomycetota bacterium]
MTDHLGKAHAAYSAFAAGFQSLILGTATPDGLPTASYTPFVRDGDGCFCIFVSGLSDHTGNLERTGKASVLLIEDESATPMIYARRRLTFTCTASSVSRGSDDWNALVERFSGRFGSIVQFFRSAADFRIIRLSPEKGLFVIGFGEAYRVGGVRMETLEHINDGGHGVTHPPARSDGMVVGQS